MSQQTQWQVGASAPEVYERDLVPAVFGPWASRVIELATPQPGERVVDVACGTGVVTRLAAERVGASGQVVGVDLNPAMIAVAQSVASKLPNMPIEWREASAMSLPLSDRAFDIVYCQLGLQFFADRPAALREMYRVLVPAGRLGVMVWRSIQYSPGFGALADALEHHVSSEAAAIMRAPFALHEADDLQALIADAGFREIMIQPATGMVRFPSVEHFVRSYVAGSPLAGHVAKVSDNARAALISDTASLLASFVSAEGLAFPIEAHLASARK
jgi:ubiquinone/menaquinone biosynthesis C-methylase UbiE